MDTARGYSAGVARSCITPDLPCEMAGYFHSRVAEGVARDLYASALALEYDGRCVVIVSVDLLAAPDTLCLEVFKEAAEAFNMPLENFVISATHTHTGPQILARSIIPMSEKALARARAGVREVVFKALENRFDSVLYIGKTQAPGLAHNRLSRCADGSEIFGRQQGHSKVIGPAGPEDHSVQVLSVYDLDKNLKAVVVNFACHPDLSGGGSAKMIDACWPGEMCEYLQQARGNDVVCLFLQGTAGDMNHADHRAAEPRWLPGGRSCVARGIAGSVLYALEISKPLKEKKIAARRKELEIPFYVRDQVLFDWVAELKAKGDKASYFEKNLISQVESWQNDGKLDYLGLNCLRIGEIALVVMPGEIFTALGLEIKRYSPASMTFIVELGRFEEYVGYKATTDQSVRATRAKGAYGALPILSQRHIPASGQMLVEAAIEMLHEIWEDSDGA